MKRAIMTALIVAAAQLSAFASPDPSVSEKVLQAFRQTFATVREVTWSESNGNYEARFTFNDLATRVVYDKDGNTIRTIRYYQEAQLPLNILAKVKSSYAGQKIHSVTEVTAEGITEYHLVLESASTWTMIMADQSGSLSVQKKMNKA